MANRHPPKHGQCETLLIEQRGCCIYCFMPLNGVVYRNGRSIDLELNWDHMVPFVYLQNNPVDNWAAACQICNSIKGDLRFPSLSMAREYIQQRREKLGYTTERPSWHDEAETWDAVQAYQRTAEKARIANEARAAAAEQAWAMRRKVCISLRTVHVEKRGYSYVTRCKRFCEPGQEKCPEHLEASSNSSRAALPAGPGVRATA